METDLKINRLSGPNKFGFYAIIFLIILFAAGAFLYQSAKTMPVSQTWITQSVLEQRYGLRVNLIAVTAAGGMVDLRLKIIDGEKAKALLQDKNNFPALQIVNRGITLNPSDDAKTQEIQFVNGENLFLLYPNQGNAVKPGTAVKLLFGDTALEPIEVK